MRFCALVLGVISNDPLRPESGSACVGKAPLPGPGTGSHRILRMVWFNTRMPNAGLRLTGGFSGGSTVVRAPGRLVHFAVIGAICTVAFSVALMVRVSRAMPASFGGLMERSSHSTGETQQGPSRRWASSFSGAA